MRMNLTCLTGHHIENAQQFIYHGKCHDKPHNDSITVTGLNPILGKLLRYGDSTVPASITD